MHLLTFNPVFTFEQLTRPSTSSGICRLVPIQTLPRALSSTTFALATKQSVVKSSGVHLGVMASLFKNNAGFSRLSFVIHIIGNVFLGLLDFTSIVKRFVFGQDAGNPDSTNSEECCTFAAETMSLLQLCPNLRETTNEQFREFHDFTVSCGQPLATVLITNRQTCRKCKKDLTVLENKVHVVVVYHSERGTYLGSRVTKHCKKCKIYEHYGFWTEQGKKHLDSTCLENTYLLSSEDTAFHTSLIRQCSNLLVVGAVAFSTFATSYNRRFGYVKQSGTTELNDSVHSKPAKRMKR